MFVLHSRRFANQDVRVTDEARLAAVTRILIGTFLVEGRKGAPAEGRLRFNPLRFHVLNHLCDEGPSRPSSLASALSVARSTVSSVSARMARDGLLERVPDRTDSRAHLLRLTVEGEQVVAAIRRQDLRNASAMLEAIGEEEREAFLMMMERLGKRLSEG